MVSGLAFLSRSINVINVGVFLPFTSFVSYFSCLLFATLVIFVTFDSFSCRCQLSVVSYSRRNSDTNLFACYSDITSFSCCLCSAYLGFLSANCW